MVFICTESFIASSFFFIFIINPWESKAHNYSDDNIIIIIITIRKAIIKKQKAENPQYFRPTDHHEIYSIVANHNYTAYSESNH